ncbi:hypothetical protein QBC32DRAFT_397157 [Pseudoneurospora amorphoporcata]|uniref:Myb-like domain-containing protein n=1 Tax=Pseudoneurospora amorphoporcata TaxID=241081 RepID=A0AAN6SHA2_9PEZI|nr:hypothetical protein QBC32DRAFT_397157 [Pseudoneurospora amorphoporcata]
MFISNPKPSQQGEEADEMVWRNSFLEPATTTPATATTTGFPPLLHNGFNNGLDHNNLEDFCHQTAQANSNDNHSASSLPHTTIHHQNHNPQFDPTSSTSHLDMDMDMDMMTSFSPSFDSSTMSASCSPSVGATWSESSPEYETCRQHEGNGDTTSSSFHRPSTTESSSQSNDAQSFSSTSDASWGSSPAPIQGSYMAADLSDTTATTATTASLASPHSRSMSAYPGQGQQHQQQQQPADFSSQNLSDASAQCLQGTVEPDSLFNNAGSAPPHQQILSDFGVVWSSAPSSQPSLTSASSSFVSSHNHHHQAAEPGWHNLHQYSALSADPMMDEPRFSSFDNMSDGGMSSAMPSSPINPFQHSGGATGHQSLFCDGLPSPTHSSFGVGRSMSSANGGGLVSLQHQQQNQYPSVMLNGGQVAASFDSGSNFSLGPSSHSSTSGGDILFRGPISHRTVFDTYPSSGGPTHLDHDNANAAVKAEGPLSVSPGSLWPNNSHNQHHKTPTPHPSPDSSPLNAHSFFHQTGNQMPSLNIDFGVNNNTAVQFGSGGHGHINTNQLHPHYVQQHQQQQSRAQRKSLPHSPPPHRMGGRPPSPRYNPGVMTTREMLPSSHPNSPSMSMTWGHHQGQGHPPGLPHHHHQALMMKQPNMLPSHAHHHQQHPQHLGSMSRRNQQPFHHGHGHGAHPYHPSSSSSNTSNTKRRAQGLPATATDHLKRARAEQDALLVRLRKQGKSYKQIAQIGRFTEAESTLRGRYRTLTKSREERVRKPEWTDKDLRLLEQAVRTLAKGPLSVTYSNASRASASRGSSSSMSVSSSTRTTTTTTPAGGGEAMNITSLVSTSSKSSAASPASPTSPSASASTFTSTSTSNQPQSSSSSSSQQPRGIPTTTTKIPWKQVAHYIVSHGGSYKFGNATVRKRWEELMRDQLARGKDLQKPFWEQRSKRSPYHPLSQSAGGGASSGFHSRGGAIAAGAGGLQGQGQGQGQRRDSVDQERGVKREAAAAAAANTSSTHMKSERDDGEGDGNLAYSDWLDMSALGDDADENNDRSNGTDGDGDYDVSDVSDSEEEEEDEDEDEDSDDDDYME